MDRANCVDRLDRELIERREYLEAVIRDRKRSLEKAPGGKLRISKCKGCTQYYRRYSPEDRNGIYIPSGEKKLIKELASKEYNRKLVAKAEQEAHAIDRYLALCPEYKIEQIYENCRAEMQNLILPVRETDEEYVKKWVEQEYQRKQMREDVPKLWTVKGELVRSKSELIIANLLEQKGVPYRYEAPLYVNGLGMIHPDFTVLKVSERREYIWEHLGMMDDSTYSKRALYRLMCYELDGFFLGSRLLVTYETLEQPLNTQHVERLITHYLL